MDDEWKVVKPKTTKKKQKQSQAFSHLKRQHLHLISPTNDLAITDPDLLKNEHDQYLVRLKKIREQLIQTRFYELCSELCQQTLQLFPSPFQRVVLLGIGNFATSSAACLQFALSLELFPVLSHDFHLYDPLLSPLEKLVCQSLGINIADSFQVHEAVGNTFFYLPHCPYSLYNKILWSNWGENLERIIILGNRSELSTFEPHSFPLPLCVSVSLSRSHLSVSLCLSLDLISLSLSVSLCLYLCLS
jgi:hypothetical protein